MPPTVQTGRRRYDVAAGNERGRQRTRGRRQRQHRGQRTSAAAPRGARLGCTRRVTGPIMHGRAPAARPRDEPCPGPPTNRDRARELRERRDPARFARPAATRSPSCHLVLSAPRPPPGSAAAPLTRAAATHGFRGRHPDHDRTLRRTPYQGGRHPDHHRTLRRTHYRAAATHRFFGRLPAAARRGPTPVGGRRSWFRRWTPGATSVSCRRRDAGRGRPRRRDPRRAARRGARRRRPGRRRAARRNRRSRRAAR